jgi:hypothetical protein
VKPSSRKHVIGGEAIAVARSVLAIRVRGCAGGGLTDDRGLLGAEACCGLAWCGPGAVVVAAQLALLLRFGHASRFLGTAGGNGSAAQLTDVHPRARGSCRHDSCLISTADGTRGLGARPSSPTAICSPKQPCGRSRTSSTRVVYRASTLCCRRVSGGRRRVRARDERRLVLASRSSVAISALT